jgi:O-antigen ligase
MSDAAGPIVPRKRMPEAFALLKSEPFALAMFFSLLLLGGDKMALNAGGLTLRLVFPLLMAAFFFLYKQRAGGIVFDRSYAALFLALALAGALSTTNSLAPAKSIGYTIWVLFDFFIIISLCYNFARLYPPEAVLSTWLWTLRIHGFLVLLTLPLSLRSGARPTLWFYETSYLAIFMTAYFGSSLYLLLRSGRRYGWDVFLSVLAMGALASATATLGILLCIFLNILVARQRLKLLLGSLIIGGCLVGILMVFFSDTFYFQLVAGFLLKPDVSMQLILQRAGNRWIRLLVGLDAFRHSPWLGIGIGGDSAYMEQRAFPENAWALVRPWSGLDVGQPFCNVVVEVMGCMGIAGLIPFAAILLRAAWQMIQTAMSRGMAAVAGGTFFVGFFSTFLALQLEGTFLRYYLWAPLGLAIGIVARMRDNDELWPSGKTAASNGKT